MIKCGKGKFSNRNFASIDTVGILELDKSENIEQFNKKIFS